MSHIPDNPAGWTIEDAKQAATNFAPAKTATAARLFYGGDHWQGGKGWVGPLPSSSSDASERSRLIAEINRQFISVNAVKEIADRQCNALFSRALTVSATARNAAENDGDRPDLLIDELKSWFSRDDVVLSLRTAIMSRLLTGRAGLRFYIPPSSLADGGIKIVDLSQAQRQLFIDAAPDGSAGIYRHNKTRQEIAIYVDSEHAEAEIAYRPIGEEVIEVRQLYQDDRRNNTYRVSLARLPIGELEPSAPFISPQIMSQQKALNLSETMLSRNIVTAGFLERTLLNAQIDGNYQVGPDGKERYVPAGPISWGAGITNVFSGVTVRNQAGQETISTPELVYHEPIKTDTFTATSDHHYARILAEAHQLHYLIAGDAVASGASRIAAMADHVISVLTDKIAIDRAFSWAAQTAASYIELMIGEPGRWTREYDITAEISAEFGPISPEMIDATVKAVQAELLSRRSGMQWIGIENAAAEAEQIEAEQRTPLVNQAAFANQLSDIGQLLARNGTTETAG